MNLPLLKAVAHTWKHESIVVSSNNMDDNDQKHSAEARR